MARHEILRNTLVTAVTLGVLGSTAACGAQVEAPKTTQSQIPPAEDTPAPAESSPVETIPNSSNITTTPEIPATPTSSETTGESSSPSDSSTSPETQIESPRRVDVPSESPIFQELSKEKQDEYFDMESLSYEEFSNLPMEQRAMYSDITYRMVEDYVAKVLSETEPEEMDISVVGTEESLTNTNNQIVEKHDFKRAAAFIMPTQNGNLNSLDPNWKRRAEYYLTGLYAESNSADLKKNVANLRELSSLAGEPYNGSVLMGMRSDDTVYKNPEDNPVRTIEYNTTFYNDSNNKKQVQFGFVEFTSFDGKKTAAWLAG